MTDFPDKRQGGHCSGHGVLSDGEHGIYSMEVSEFSRRQTRQISLDHIANFREDSDTDFAEVLIYITIHSITDTSRQPYSYTSTSETSFIHEQQLYDANIPKWVKVD